MDYKEKYEMALEGIQEILGSGEDSIKMSRLQLRLQGIFPELKGSEDEKIRKAIEYAIGQSTHSDGTLINGVSSEEALAWLEKQGEQKPLNKIKMGKEYKCIASPRYSAFIRGNIYKPEDEFVCSLMNFCSDCFEPIENGKQNHNGKIIK